MKLKKIIIAICCLFIGGAIIFNPERYIATTLSGIILWAECVVPSLFIFMVIIAILIKTGVAEDIFKPFYGIAQKLKLPNCAVTCFFMSISSGYPAGSKVVEEFYTLGTVDRFGANKLAMLCSTSGPLFIIGSVGVKMFNSNVIGIKIFLAHALSVLAFSIIFSLFTKPCKSAKIINKSAGKNLLNECFYGAVTSVLTAGAFICFFYTVTQIIFDFNLLYPLYYALNTFLPSGICEGICRGLIEATGGCASLAQCGGKVAVAASGFIITFGGASILLQQLCYLVKTGISAPLFIFYKFLQALICAVILYFIA